MDTEDQNAVFEAAKEIVLEAREKMASCMEEVLVVGMSLRYHRGKKREVAIGELLAIYSDRNEVLVRKGRIIESIPVIDIAEILDAPEPFDEDMFEEDEDKDLF